MVLDKGSTALHCASASGCLSVVEYLVNHGADIYSKTEDVDLSYMIGLFFI